MPQPRRRRLLRIKFKRSSNSGKKVQEGGATSPQSRGTGNLETGFPAFDEPNKSKQSSGLRQSACSDKLEKAKMPGGMPDRSSLNAFSGKSVKSQNVTVDKFATRNAALLGREVNSRGTVSESLMQKEHDSERLFSVLVCRGRLIKSKVANRLLGRKVWGDKDNAKRLPQAKRIELFQTLLNEPVTFLDLHIRFGVSKQTIRRLVKNGLLIEEWGPNEIGLRFQLSKKGKTYLKELEAAALYESKMGQKNLIRLKSKS